MTLQGEHFGAPVGEYGPWTADTDRDVAEGDLCSVDADGVGGPCFQDFETERFAGVALMSAAVGEEFRTTDDVELWFDAAEGATFAVGAKAFAAGPTSVIDDDSIGPQCGYVLAIDGDRVRVRVEIGGDMSAEEEDPG